MKKGKVNVLSGKLAQRFIDTIAAATDFLKEISVKGTEQSSGNITLLDVEDYGLVIPTNRQTGVTFAVDANQTVAFATAEICYPKIISDSDLEDMGINPASMENINAGDGKLIADLLATAFGKNLQDLIINGDDSLGSVAGRQDMLRQKDGIFAALSTASQVIASATHDTVVKEVAALYEAYIALGHHSSFDKIYVGFTQWAGLIKLASKTTYQLTYANGKLYYIDTEVKPISRMTNNAGAYQMLIGNPNAVLGRIKREIKIEIERSLEYRGWKYLIDTRIDWPVLTDYFYGLTHTT